MLNKEYDKLSTKEFFRLNKIVKRKENGLDLNSEDQRIYSRFIGEYEKEKKKVNAKRPFFVLAFVVIGIAILFELI